MSDTEFEAPSLESLGEKLPAYDFHAFIAKGGMGAVYLARQRSLDRDVAIKVLPRELGEDPEFRESFIREARAMARLNHPNLIGVYDSGDIDGMPYIVMEYVDGQSLYHSSYGIAVDPVQAAAIVKSICEGLAHAHEHGIIHRDIKPANILLNQRAEPKIGDFGLARPAGIPDAPGNVMGTLGYVAPEVLSHPESADHRADIFAVGVILYQLLTGHQPGPNPPPPSHACQCGPVLDQICLKALHPNPAFRYRDAGAVAEALRQWLAKPTTGVGGAKLVVGGAPRVGALANRRPGGTGIRRPKPKPPQTARNAAIAAILVIVVAVVFAVTSGKSQKNREIQTQNEHERKLAAMVETDAAEPKPEPPPAPSPTNAATPAEPTPEPRPDEPPLVSLSRLKPALAAGERREFPNGAQRRTGSHFMFIPTAMTWHEAARFAAEHGAFLASPRADTDIHWLGGLIDEESGAEMAWVGAGRSGRNDWSLMDGSSWSLTAKPAGAGSHAAVNALGSLRARQPDEVLPFILQWSDNGENPGALEAMLARTSESLAAGSPLYPPGTLAYDARNFLILPGSFSREKAETLAKTAGGHLAGLGTRAEAEWLAERVKPFGNGTCFWLGGEHDGEDWTWTSGEAWASPAWASGEPAADAPLLALVVGEGWRAKSPGETCGLVIEWSGDATAAN